MHTRLLFLDHRITGLGGVEFVKKIRKRYEKLYIMVVSYVRSEEDVPNTIEAGADDFIAKPVDPLILMGKASLYS